MRSRTIARLLVKPRTHPHAGHIHGGKVVASRVAAVLMLAAVALGLVAPAAHAVPEQMKLEDNFDALWTAVLKTPYDRNPIGGGPMSKCIDIGGRTVAPFGPGGAGSCAVKPGTKIFIAVSPFLCKAFEGDGRTEAQLRECARKADVQTAPSVTVDGRSLSMTEVETQLLRIDLPENNIFRRPAGTGSFVGHGWVTLLEPLPSGMHTITIDDRISTRIIVRRVCPSGTGGSHSCTHVAKAYASQI